MNVMAILGQTPNDLTHLVGGDPAAHAYCYNGHDALPVSVWDRPEPSWPTRRITPVDAPGEPDHQVIPSEGQSELSDSVDGDSESETST